MATNFTFQDLNGCNCATGYVCGSCIIPEANLSLSYVSSGGSGSTSLTYTSGLSPISGKTPAWYSPCITIGTHTFAFEVTCSSMAFGPPVLSVYLYGSPCVGYPGTPLGTTTATGESCTSSPFNLSYTHAFQFVTFTSFIITP